MLQALFVDGTYVGNARWAYGGFNKGLVTSMMTGGGVFPHKRLSGVTATPLVLNIDLGLGRPVYDWISKSWRNGIEKRNCAIALYNDAGDVSPYRWNLFDACISEVEIPACDRSKQEHGYFTLTIAPSRIEYATGSPPISGSTDRGASRRWLLSDFRVEIGDLPCNRVRRIESFTWKQQVVGAPQVVVPDLMLTIPFSDIQPWEDWYRRSVIEGRGDKRNGCLIQLLAHNMPDVLARIGLEGVGIFSLGIESKEVESSGVNSFQVGLYCEQMHLGN
jgi:hypothetical protein